MSESVTPNGDPSAPRGRRKVRGSEGIMDGGASDGIRNMADQFLGVFKIQSYLPKINHKTLLHFH